ncbi:MAG: hypothetical protein HYY65_06150 [Candidatus Tectomicrobia bacterium]|uniref:Nucleotidyl transferase AbiEii/AbiGii toxin family protein n=1 Tax=Tectimicrobiota bacterium TaxID=2528274 RepID=A0A932M082_UNCTE|nr:hypothetical protein [Candidatus Tectomicrobia bacterium]
MVTQRDYSAEAVEACRSVLIELIHLMGQIRDHTVVVGGWVPPLLFPQASEPHAGTLDIDLALDFRRIPEESYRTILETFASRGYRQDPDQPFRFFREIPLPGRDPVVIEVDLLSGEYGGTGPGHRTQPVQDVRARKARGCDLAFSNPVQVSVEGELPGGGRDRVTFRVAGIVPWLVMKGMALADRLKEKDAYDIDYCVRHYPGGTAGLAEAFRPHISNRLVREGLGKIRSQFLSVDHAGPKWVADFLEITDPEERAIIERRAYEMVTAWLDALNIAPWDED